MINWTPYLKSVCKKYAQWWDVYTLTDVAGKMRSPNTTPLLTDLRVQEVKKSREEREEKTEQYSVLEGLRKYAANHVLLVGRPGSGKSTAIVRLLLEESEKARDLLADNSNQKKIIQIPILVELRYYETSIIDLILEFLKCHDLIIDSSELETILLGKTDISLLLLFDGVNELPSDKARSNLQKFRRQNEKIPMIFTTRDIEIGGVEQRLDILPLTKPQMEQFVYYYFPEMGKQVLTQLGTHLREFGETPLLLWMLCFVFANNKDEVPSTSGLLFCKFAEIFEKKKMVKEQIEIPKLLRVFYKKQLLQHLAWVMTEGYIPTEPKLSMPKDRVQKILIEFLDGKIEHSETTALEWLEYLINYYLIQVTSDGQGIEFCHQAIQEYYAAEALLEKLEKKSELSDEEWQWNYLNYLKWTEPFALMLGMVEDKAKAIHLVELALAVDVRLGARLAGEIKKDWHETTIDLILGLNLPKLFTVDLLGRTRSDVAITWLIKALKDYDPLTYIAVAHNIAKIGSKLVIPDLMKILKDDNFHASIRGRAINILGKISTEEVIPQLVEAFQDSSPNIRSEVIEAIGKIRSQEILKQNSSKSILDLLNKALDDPDDYVRHCATYFLNKNNLKFSEYSNSYIPVSDNDYEEEFNTNDLEPKTVIAMLLNTLENSDFSSSSDVFWAIKTLKNFGKIDIEMAMVISQLNERIKNSDWVKLNNDYSFNYAIQSLDAIQKEIGYYQQNSKPMNQKIYISYNWQEDSNEIANQIVQAFEAKGIEVIRDKTHTSYKDSIKKFMQQIGQGECVIAVISDRYLKSPNCMFELVEIAKDGDFYNRIFPVVLPDAKIYNPIERIKYIHYWEEQIHELDTVIKSAKNSANLQGFTDDLNLYTEIRSRIASITDVLRDMNTLNKNVHIETDFAEMIQAVVNKLEEDNNTSTNSSPQTLNPSQSITYDFRGATIGNFAHNVEGNQQTTQNNQPE